ncbi:anti-sigma factor [Microvirga sp. VF16]|uniref:anti-sigma factor family protein n=1 Tax=Microvirga sp. VF16 TaxID=2807101 RepID=UPI00193E6CE6|nr:anti-sigma factor [Microvirga sp. VF16]QRM35292.1 anti-sigma factor [Microvirga sp. VF16]
MKDNRRIGEDDLHALIDGRLPVERRAAVGVYLAATPQAAARVLAYQKQRAALRDRLALKANEPVPSRLRIANITAERRRRRRERVTSFAAALALIALGGVLGWLVHEWSGDPTTAPIETVRTPVADDAISAHRTFAVEVAHPVEVSASQEQQLIQWLSKRLGPPLQIPNLNDLGFRLMGGRLLPAGTGPAAQFMFEDAAGTRVTLYVQVRENEETAFRSARDGEVSTFYWIKDGLGYAISAALERDRLLAIAEAAYRQLESDNPKQKRTTL